MENTSPKLERVLRPKSIAVFGGQFAEAVCQQCDNMQFAGEIWPVHPYRETIAGRRCFRAISELPEPPDVSFIGVNRHQSIEIVNELNACGAGGAVCYASGFKESGGDELNQQLIQAAGEMPILGPNCYGFINYLDGALLWPDQHGGKRLESGVAVLMQSSNMAINLTMNKRATPIAYMITLGNQAMIGMSDMMIQLCQDDRVSAIGLHIEALDDVSRFSQAIAYAHRCGKPVVVLKTGKSDKGAAITLSHTASLSSNDQVMNALFDRVGIARVHTLEAFLESLKLLHLFGALPGNDLVSMSCSGGEASLICDAAEGFMVEFRDFCDEDIERIQPTVHELVSISNPFDYHTFDWADYDRLLATFSAVMESAYTLSLLVIDFPRDDRCRLDDWMITIDAWQAAAKNTASKTAILASLPETMPEAIAQKLLENNVAPLCGIEAALAAIAAVAKIDARSEAYVPVIDKYNPAEPVDTLSEFDSKHRLAAYSLPIAASQLCRSEAQAICAAEKIGFPVVLKAVGEQLVHKTEMDAVKLDLTGAEDVSRAVMALSGLASQFLVEKMIQQVEIELIVGINRDPVAGLYLVIGAGGIYTELLRDTAVVLFPFDRAQVSKAIDTLKIARMLKGYRKRPPISTACLLDAIMNIQRFALAHQDDLVELDINPLIVCANGKVVVADALIRKTP